MIGIEKGNARGLMAFWANIPPEHERTFLEWHNTEHIPERVAVPGFKLGRRYRVASDTDRFLMCYDTKSADILTSKPYLEALNAPTPRTRQALTWFRDPLRNLYSLEDSSGEAGPTAAPVLATLRIDAGKGPAATQSNSLDPAELATAAHAATSSDLIRLAIYRVDPAGAGVSTGERAIHGAAVEEAGTLIWIETTDLGLLEEPEKGARFEQALKHHVAASIGERPVHFEFAWLDFVDLPLGR